MGAVSSSEDLPFQGPEPGLGDWKGEPPSSSTRNEDFALMGRGSELWGGGYHREGWRDSSVNERLGFTWRPGDIVYEG